MRLVADNKREMVRGVLVQAAADALHRGDDHTRRKARALVAALDGGNDARRLPELVRRLLEEFLAVHQDQAAPLLPGTQRGENDGLARPGRRAQQHTPEVRPRAFDGGDSLGLVRAQLNAHGKSGRGEI